MGIFSKYFGGKKIKTGNNFNQDYGPDSLHRIILRAKVHSPQTLRNLSYKELDKLEKMIAKYAKSVSTTSGFSYKTKWRMKQETAKLWRQGEITKQDMEDFNKIIDEL